MHAWEMSPPKRNPDDMSSTISRKRSLEDEDERKTSKRPILTSEEAE